MASQHGESQGNMKCQMSLNFGPGNCVFSAIILKITRQRHMP